jgi:tetratricopeptide (TPR) repeat protein
MTAAFVFAATLLLSQPATDAYSRAQALFKQRNMAAARQAVDEALTLDPRFVPALLLKAKLAMAQGEMDDAQRALETAISADPKQSYPRFLLGFLFYLKNDFERARAALARADQNDARVTFYQAMTEEGLNNTAEAERLYQRTLKLDTSMVEPRVSYARLLFDRGDRERAEALIDEALALSPGDPDALCEKARCLVQRGEYRKAAHCCEKALTQPISPVQERRIRYHLIRAYQKLGKTEEAGQQRALFDKLPNPLVR